MFQTVDVAIRLRCADDFYRNGIMWRFRKAELEEVVHSGEHVMPAIMEAVRAYATIGEV